jgi:prepilin-type N-terminal cleavage/methylation domain-containing protein
MVSFRKEAQTAGFTLVEVMVSMGVLAAIITMLSAVLSYSVQAQRESRRQLTAARIGDQIIECLRSVPVANLTPVEFADISQVAGGATGNPVVNKIQGSILTDLQDQLSNIGLSAYATIRKWHGYDQARAVTITITEQGRLAYSHKRVEAAAPGEMLLKFSTVFTQGGISP